MRRVYPFLGLPRLEVTNLAIVVHIFAVILAIVLTVLGILVIGKHKKRRAKELTECAAEAVRTAAGLTVGNVAENEKLLSLCVNLSGQKRETIRSRAQFYQKVDAESVGHYLPSGSQEVTAAHIVALLTDLPARWLFDCATNRRGTLKAN
jgi:type IV pilus biogenesis protein CpaD/CtpE